jgi:hypothetical protein
MHADCAFLQFTHFKAAAVSVGSGTAAAFHRTWLSHNTLNNVVPKTSGTAPTQQLHQPLGTAIVAGPHSMLLLDDCTLQDNHIEASDEAGVAAGTPNVSASFGLPFGVSTEVAAVSAARGATVFANPAREFFDYSARVATQAMQWNPTDDFPITEADFAQFSKVIIISTPL